MDSALIIPVVSVIIGALIAIVFFGSYFRKRRSEVQTISHPELPSDPKKQQKPPQTKKPHSKSHSHSSDKVRLFPEKLHETRTKLSQFCSVLFSAQNFVLDYLGLATSSDAKFRNSKYAGMKIWILYRSSFVSRMCLILNSLSIIVYFWLILSWTHADYVKWSPFNYFLESHLLCLTKYARIVAIFC